MSLRVKCFSDIKKRCELPEFLEYHFQKIFLVAAISRVFQVILKLLCYFPISSIKLKKKEKINNLSSFKPKYKREVIVNLLPISQI